MLLHKTVEHDARVRREAGALAEAGHEVVIVHLPRGADPPPSAASEGYELRSGDPPAWAERLPGGARRALAAARIARVAAALRPDVVHAHDAAMLAPGWLVAKRTGAGLVYDSHELATGVPYHSRAWYRLVSTLERRIVPRCAAVITVSDGIAERLQQMYGLERRPTVVRNLPDLPPPGAGAEDLRASLGVGTAPLVLHHGAAAQDRGAEALIRSLAQLDGAHLLFLGAEGGYADDLRALSAQLGLGSGSTSALRSRSPSCSPTRPRPTSASPCSRTPARTIAWRCPTRPSSTSPPASRSSPATCPSSAGSSTPTGSAGRWTRRTQPRSRPA